MYNTVENDIPIITWYLRTQIDKLFKDNKCRKVEQNIDGYFIDYIGDDFFGDHIVRKFGTLIESNKSIGRYIFMFKANDHSYIANVDVIQSPDVNNTALYVYDIVNVVSVDNLYKDEELINTIYRKIDKSIYDHCKPFIKDNLLEGDTGYLFDKEHRSIHINSFAKWPMKTFERLIETSCQDSDDFVVLYKKINSITLQFKEYTDVKYNLVLTYRYDAVDQTDISINTIRLDIPYIEKLPKQEN